MNLKEAFNQNKIDNKREILIEYSIEFPVMMIHSQLKDDYHDFHVYWKIDIPSSEILVAEGYMDDQPFDDCSSSLNIFQKMKGLKVWKGVKKEFLHRFKKVEGCTHLTEIAFATFDFILSRLHGPTSRPMSEKEKDQLRCGLAKMICDNNSCTVYNQKNWQHFDARGAYKGKNYME